MPSAVAVVWTLTPLHIPSAVITAARRPRDMPWATTNVLSGPGAIVSRSDAPRKASKFERDKGILLGHHNPASGCPAGLPREGYGGEGRGRVTWGFAFFPV